MPPGACRAFRVPDEREAGQGQGEEAREGATWQAGCNSARSADRATAPGSNTASADRRLSGHAGSSIACWRARHEAVSGTVRCRVSVSGSHATGYSTGCTDTAHADATAPGENGPAATSGPRAARAGREPVRRRVDGHDGGVRCASTGTCNPTGCARRAIDRGRGSTTDSANTCKDRAARACSRCSSASHRGSGSGCRDYRTRSRNGATNRGARWQVQKRGQETP